MSKAKRKPDNVLRSIYAFRPNKPIKVTVKTRRYKQDAKDKAFRRGAYSNVRDPRKTQARQSIATYIRVSPDLNDQRIKKRRSVSKPDKPSELKSGDDLSSRSVSRQVLSARESLTSVFGMGTGGSFLPLSPLWLYTKP